MAEIRNLACVIVGSLLILFYSRGEGQDLVSHRSHETYGWVDLGLGSMGTSHMDASGGTISLSYLSRTTLITLRAVGGEQGYFSLDSGEPSRRAIGEPPVPRSLYEVGALYGYAFNSDFLFVSASTGFAVTWGTFIFPDRTFLSPGLPLEIQAFVNVLPVIGVGGKLMVDVNPTSSFSSVMLCARFGALRYVK